MYFNLSVKNDLSKGRLKEIKTDVRDIFERDRDRVLHSTAFRKLKDKTQVFMFEKGDYYRNRLTHTLEVVQLSRSLSRRLGLNEDLSEVIALSHDLGHTPFGHAGEEIIFQEIDKTFNHNVQSFRQVTLLEKKYIDYEGLNLSWETLDGIIKHNGPVLNSSYDFNLSKNFIFDLGLNPSLEAQVATICDDIAYIAHDFDDALRSKAISLEQIQSLKYFFEISKYKMEDTTDLDIFKQTIKNITDSGISTASEVIHHKEFLVEFSPESKILVLELKKFLFNNFYTSDLVIKGKESAQSIVRFVIDFLMNNVKSLPDSWLSKIDDDESKKRVIIDYICGMTDQFAINFHQNNV
jgi:dGTPase